MNAARQVIVGMLYPSAGMTRIRFVGLEKLLSAPWGTP